MNISSLEDYQANLAQIEKAKRVLNAYEAMNEDAKHKFEYQQELARKIAEGDKARQELEVLRHREALAITAPPRPPSVPQAAPPVYVQTTARIEEIPTHGHAEQRNPYASNTQQHWHTQRQEQTQQHNFYPMPQYTDDSVFRSYYPEQQTGNQQVYPTNQPSGQYQSSPVWPTYVRQQPSQQYQQQYQQQRPQLPTTPNIRPAAPEARPQTQRMTASHRDHPRGPVTPVSYPVAFSNPQPTSASSAISSFPDYSTSAAPEPVSSSTPESQVFYAHEPINIRPAAPELRPQKQRRRAESHPDHSQQRAIIPVSNSIAFSKSQPSNASSTPYTHETITIRPTVLDTRPQTQRMTEPHSPQGAITPVSNPIALSKSQPNNASSTPSGFANSFNSVAAPEAVSSSASAAQKAPYTRPAAPETRPQTQRTTEPHRDHSQQGAITPVATSVALPKSQPNNASNTSSNSVAAIEPVSASALETQKSDLAKNLLPTQPQTPTTPPTLYKPTSDVHLRQFTTNLDLIRYLTASYSTWLNDMPQNSYYPISNTPYYVWKSRDNIPLFVFPNASKAYTCLDIKKLIPEHAHAPPSSKRENTHPTTPNQIASLSNLPQTKNLQPAQAVVTIPAQLPSMGENNQPMVTNQIRFLSSPSSQTENLHAAQVTTPVLKVKSYVSTQPQQRPGIVEHAYTSPKRTPADADKRNLARDILKALSLKRLRPPESPTPQTMERPAKRHEQEPSVPLPNGASESVISDFGNPSSMPAPVPTTPLPVPTTSMEVPSVPSPSLPLVRIVELPTEPEPKQSVEDVVTGAMNETLVSGAAQSNIMDVDETTDDAVNSLNLLTIQEQTVIPAAEGEQVLRAQIGGEIQVPSEATKDVQKEVEEREAQVPTKATKDGQEESEKREVQVPIEASKEEEEEIEEGEVQAPTETPKAHEEEEVEEGEIRMTRLPEGDRRPPTSITPIRKNVEGNEKPVAKTPLFLPSPSPSPLEARSPEGSRRSSAHPPPDSSILDEDSPMANSARDEAVLKRQQHISRYQRSSRKREFYILVPSLPSYVRKYKEQEARKRKRRKLLTQERDEDGGRARSPSEDIASDPRVQLTIKKSVTRIAERRCKWGGCDAIMNSSQNLFEHLKRNHSTPNSSKPYILCNWSGCGDHVRNKRIEDHLESHSFPSFLCPYVDCDESFRSVQALVRHNDAEHASDELKSTPDPFSPHVQEPPPIPSKVPDYLIKSGLVRQEPIPRGRHAVLGPWVYNNIAGPVKVTKRYNAAKEKPAEYGFLQSSSMQFSTNPSQPAKIRDLGDLASGEVSEMISEGLYLWPPRKAPSVVVSSSEDELDGLGLIKNVAVAPIGDKSSVTHQSTSEEDAVETMLTGQPYGS